MRRFVDIIFADIIVVVVVVVDTVSLCSLSVPTGYRFFSTSPNVFASTLVEHGEQHRFSL